MKINPRQFDEILKALADPAAEERWKAVRCLAAYSGAEWESSPEAVEPAVEAILNPALLRGSRRQEFFLPRRSGQDFGPHR